MERENSLTGLDGSRNLMIVRDVVERRDSTLLGRQPLSDLRQRMITTVWRDGKRRCGDGRSVSTKSMRASACA